MAEPICEDDGTLQEWGPETRLLQQIPLKVQKGIFSHNLNLTCLDAVSKYIALGTNCGIIYWYNRATNELQRLQLENSNNIITCIKVVSTVDYMVAAGTDRGNVTVYQIPKILPDSIPDSLKHKKKQIERFTINGLHNVPVSCIEWSQNGMKLFTGDKNGLVVLTEIDFHMHISKSTELLNEQFEIVQLSYNQQTLLISTTFRSIISDGLDKWKVHQVGTKERKILGKFGATFFKVNHGSVIYASRPDHRLWLANRDGVVQQTLLFKSAIPKSYPKVKLINPINKVESCDIGFGKLVQFGANKLIAYNSEIMYVLHPDAISIVSCLDSARRILDLSVNKDEIFILEGTRSLLRLSYAPDKYCFDTGIEGPSRRRSFIFDEFASKLKGTAMESIKKFTSELIITSEEVSPNSPPVVADEALELPPIINLPAGSISRIVPEENVEIHFSVDVHEDQNVGDHRQSNVKASNYSFQCDIPQGKECDEIISRPLRRRNPKKSKIFTAMSNTGHESESDTNSNTSEDRLVWGIANELSISEESAISFSQSQSSFSILRDIPTLLTANNSAIVKSKTCQDGISKASEDKSQTSLDTCESVSENLKLTPERFLEEQEKTFFRLANQEISLLDSYNSEKTDNMSISLNMSPSSSVSSKISDNIQSTSENVSMVSENISMVSENVSMASENRTENSPATNNLCNSQNNMLPLPKQLCFWNPNDITQTNHNNTQKSASSQEDKSGISAESSLSSENSQQFLNANNKVLSKDGLLANEECCGSKEMGSKNVNENCLKETSIQGNIPKENSQLNSDVDFEIKISASHKNQRPIELKTRPESNDLFVVKNENEEELDRQDKSEKNQSVSNHINCGPPDDCSMLFPNTLSEYSFFGNLDSISDINVEQADHWLEYSVPNSIVHLVIASNYVVCVDSKEEVYFSELSGMSLFWKKLPYKASRISLSENCDVIWVQRKKSVFSLTNSAAKGLFVNDMTELFPDAINFAVDNKNPEGWIIKTNGQIKHQKNLLVMPLEKPEEVHCDWLLTSVVSWNGMVLAITCEDTVVCKSSEEQQFRSIVTPRSITTHIELGPENLAWIVDDQNNIYFSDDFLDKEPHWWQVMISDYVFQTVSSSFKVMPDSIRWNNFGTHTNMKNVMIASNANSIWVYEKFSNKVKVNKTAVNGYMWNKVVLSLKSPLVSCQSMCANGIFENKGRLWLLSSSCDLFCFKSNSKYFQSVSAPCESIRCISSSTDALIVLSSDGRLYSRLGLNGKNLIGSSWKELHLPEINDFQLIWISCGCDVIWGCDARGRIFVTIDSPYHMATNIFNSAWLEVEGQPKKGAQFVKVFVGPNLYMVWAIDNKKNVYVREGIFPHFQIGTSWVLVAGLEAEIITISSTTVWLLTSSGDIYRRYGISESNYIGDYWKQVPGNLKYITSSFTDDLWGLDHSDLVLQLSSKTIILDKQRMMMNEESLVSTSSFSNSED